MRTYSFFLAAAMAIASGMTQANNITTSAGSLVNNTGTTVQVQFDITWANSWRIAPDRWDAAWIFVKYRASVGLWRHCSLNNTGHTAPAGSTITPGLVNPSSTFTASTNPVSGCGASAQRRPRSEPSYRTSSPWGRNFHAIFHSPCFRSL